MYVPLNEKGKFVDLFILFDTEGRKMQTPRRIEWVVSTQTILELQLLSWGAPSYYDFISWEEFPFRWDLFSIMLSVQWVPENWALYKIVFVILVLLFHVLKTHALLHNFRTKVVCSLLHIKSIENYFQTEEYKT